MVWAATKTSTGVGNWNAAGTWNPAGVPGQDDYVEVQHNVMLNDYALGAGLYLNGGILGCFSGYTLTLKDAAGTHPFNAHIGIASTVASGFYRYDSGNGLPFVIKSQNAVPTYPIKMIIGTVPIDTRTLLFDYCELRNFAPSIGHISSSVFFNTGDVTNDGVLDVPLPIRRDQKIDEVYCEGRSYDRIYPEGGHAGVLDLSGLVPWTGYTWQKLSDLTDARVKVSFIGQFSTMPKAIIESLRFGKRDGPYVPFTATLVESR